MSEESSTELGRLAVIREQPFHSDLPIVGRLVAWFRTLWNNVSTRWYVLPLLQQQNNFNAQVVVHLHELSGRSVEIDRDLTALTRSVSELSHRLIQLERRLEALEASRSNEIHRSPAR